MTLALIIISILLATTIVVLSFSVYLNIKLTRQVFVLEEQVEKSLDILDNSYQSIVAIASHPVLSDEPIIREVMNKIRMASHAVHLVANNLVVFGQNEEDAIQELNDDTTSNNA